MAVADRQFQPFIALCAFAGLRLGEAAGVRLGDVDFLRKSLKVSRQVQRVNGGSIDVRAPKYGSERVVYLADSLVNVLAEHVGAHGTTGEDRWLLAGEGDDPPHQNTVVYWWRKTLRDAELSGIKLQDLRHFYASGLIAAGCDVVTVQRSLGHAKATTTLNTYAHLWPTAEDRTRKARGRQRSQSCPRRSAHLPRYSASWRRIRVSEPRRSLSRPPAPASAWPRCRRSPRASDSARCCRRGSRWPRFRRSGSKRRSRC